jgi:hypothetical protein
MSGAPPAPKPTMMRTGRDGTASANNRNRLRCHSGTNLAIGDKGFFREVSQARALVFAAASGSAEEEAVMTDDDDNRITEGEPEIMDPDFLNAVKSLTAATRDFLNADDGNDDDRIINMGESVRSVLEEAHKVSALKPWAEQIIAEDKRLADERLAED